MSTPFDSGFKSSTARDPRGMLFLVNRLGLEEPAEVLPFEREIVPEQKTVDFLLEVRQGGVSRLEQLEALARWHIREEEAILLRSMAVRLLAEARDKHLCLTVLLLNKEHTPEELPAFFTDVWGVLEVKVEPEFVKIWELDADRALESGRPALLPWIGLMKGGEARLPEVAARLAALGDEELSTQFVTLGSLRYDEEYLRLLIGRNGSMLTAQLAAQTPFGEKIAAIGFEKGREKGIEQGIERGIEQGIERGIERGARATAELHVLKLAGLRFPGLAAKIDRERLSAVADLEGLFDKIGAAPDEESAWAEIERAGAARIS